MHCFEEVNARINRLKREGGVGWSEPGKVLTWDGDTSEQVMLAEIPAVKVHDKCMDLSNVASLTLVPTDPDMSGDYVLTADSFTALLDPDIGIYVLVLNDNIAGGDGETPSIIGVPAKPTGEAAGMGMSEGVYITLLATPMRISKITFAETITPIDKKYLPVNVVDLDKYGITEVLLALFQNGGGTFSGNDVGDFWEAVNTENQLKISFMFPPDSRVHVNNITAVRATFSDGEKTVQVCFECIINKGTVYRVAVMIVRKSNGADVTVKVDVV